jgi:hypothetical protein
MSWKREGKEEGREKQEVGGGGRTKNPEPCPGLGWVTSYPKKSQNRIFWMVHWWVLGHSSPPGAYWTANSNLSKTVIPHHSS